MISNDVRTVIQSIKETSNPTIKAKKLSFYMSLSIREDYASLSDDKGPYHMEVFPYHYYEPERILLKKRVMSNDRSISSDTELILVELNI